MLDNIAQLFFAEDVDFLLTRGVDVLERAEVHYALVDRHRSRATVLIDRSFEMLVFGTPCHDGGDFQGIIMYLTPAGIRQNSCSNEQSVI